MNGSVRPQVPCARDRASAETAGGDAVEVACDFRQDTVDITSMDVIIASSNASQWCFIWRDQDEGCLLRAMFDF